MLVLTLSIAIQLSLFFMTVTVSLWLDRLINIGQLADLRKAYIATSIITLTVSPFPIYALFIMFMTSSSCWFLGL